MILTVDLRMYRHSGIGRYLRNLFPLLLHLLEADQIRILGSTTLIGGPSWLADSRIQLIETTAPIYSIAEQRLLMAVPSHHLLWVPHFNAPLLRRGPMVVTIHDVAPLAMPQILGSALKRAYAKLLIERAASQASAILCASNFTRSELATRLHIPAEKMTVTHLGLDSDWPSNAAPHLEDDAVPYLLYVGNVKPNKNLTLLITAFASVQHRLPYRLVLAGRFHGLGTGDAAVLRQAEALGDKVRFAGEVVDAQLQRLYAGAAALVLPSLYEGFGLPVLEAMSLGCPVLSSTAGSLPEVGGNAALYFDSHSSDDLAAALIKVPDPAAMDNLRTLGRARIEAFSFQTCAHQTAAVLNHLLTTNHYA